MLHRWQSFSHSQILHGASTTAGVAALPETALETETDAMAIATMLRTQIIISEHCNGYNDMNVYQYLQSHGNRFVSHDVFSTSKIVSLNIANKVNPKPQRKVRLDSPDD